MPELWKNNIFRRTVKTAAWTIGTAAGLILILAIALQFPQVQSRIARAFLAPVSERTHTRIELGSVTISLPSTIVLKDIFIEGQSRDTLLAVGELRADVHLIGLFSRTVTVSTIRVDSLTAHITRTLPDSAFNFDFLLDALSSDSSGPAEPSDAAETADGGGWSIDLGGISLRTIDATYDDDVSGVRVRIGVGELDVSIDRMDMERGHIAFARIALANSTVDLSLPPSDDTPPPDDTTALPWSFELADLSLGLNTLRVDVRGEAHRAGFDPNHMNLYGISLQGEHLYLDGSRAGGRILRSTISDRSGLAIREISGTVVFDSLHADVTNARIVTATTSIGLDARLAYSSPAAFTTRLGDVRVHASVTDSFIGVPDLLLFDPSLPIKRSRRAIRVAAAVSGSVGGLRIERFSAAAGDSAAIELTGSVNGLPDMSRATFDITFDRIAAGRSDIRLFASDSLLPAALVVPTSMTLTGRVIGSLADFSATTTLQSSIGSLSARASMQRAPDDATRASARENTVDATRWKLDASAADFDLGALTTDTTGLGRITFTVAAEGTGSTARDLRANATITVDTVVVFGYPYRNLTVVGTGGADMFDGRIELRDSNIVFVFEGSVNIGTDHPASAFTFDLQGADLRRLGLTEEEIRVSASVAADVTGRDADDVNGRIDVRNIVVTKNQQRFAIDSLMIAAVNADGRTHISIESPVFGALYDGTIPPGKLGDAMTRHIDRYFALHDTLPAAPADSQSFTFTFELRNPETITGIFFPSLTRLDAGSIEAVYNSAKRDLTVIAGMSGLTYEGFSIDTLLFYVSSDDRQLRSALRAGSLSGPQFLATNLEVDGTIEQDSIDMSVKSTDRNGGTKLLLAGILNSGADGYQFHFHRDGVILHDRQWDVPADHFITFGKDRFVAHNVVLSDTGQSLSVQSMDETAAYSPLTIAFTRFRLATLSRIAERDSGFAGGIVDGLIELRGLNGTAAFTSDLVIGDFAFGGTPVGDLMLRANNITPDVYDIWMVLTGNGNTVGMQGQYTTRSDESMLDLGFEFGALNLASIEPFTFGTVTRLMGAMTGSVHVTGTTTKPVVRGTLSFAETGFNLSMLDSYLRLSTGEIGLDARGIALRSVTLVDTLGNTASINGYLTTDDYTSFGYALSVHTDNFLLMNTAPATDARYYGTVYIDSDIRLKGTRMRPVVDIQAKLGKGTSVTFVLPESGAELLSREGLVSFVDVQRPGNPIMARKASAHDDTDSLTAAFGGIDLTSNIEVTKDSKLRILVDPISGDSLVAQGDASFSVGMYPSGGLSVTGRYEISSGSYLLSFNELLKRDFKIEKGSSLTWFGTPFDANVDITAVYTVKTSALDLVQDQIAGMSQEERTKYRQVLPIQVYLTMKGRLLKPEIGFRIELPEAQRGALGGTIHAKLMQVNAEDSELNKQVFALLMLGRFVPSDPLSMAGDGNGLTGIARSSVSSLLTSQLNRLSRKYVKAVDVSVGIESGQDYSTGTAENRTQLQLALSKSLFDERVTVQVGGNVDLEGRRSQQNSLNSFSGDIKVGYKLTEDGRWQLLVFRQQAYEGVIEGDLTETGVGIVFTIDYDTLVGFTLKPVGMTSEKESK